jgi:hypothetical protein
MGVLLDDSSSNRYVSGEGTLLVNVVSFNGFGRGLESESDIFPITDTLGRFLSQEFFAIQEKSILLLKGFLNLLKINKVTSAIK